MAVSVCEYRPSRSPRSARATWSRWREASRSVHRQAELFGVASKCVGRADGEREDARAVGMPLMMPVEDPRVSQAGSAPLRHGPRHRSCAGGRQCL